LKFISVDTESDQPTGEIIQIGAVSMDFHKVSNVKFFNVFLESKNMPDLNWNYPVRNPKAKTLEELWGFTREAYHSLKIDRTEAFKQFWQFVRTSGAGGRIIQWGKGDMADLVEQSKAVGVKDIPKFKEINIKRVYNDFFRYATNMPKGGGLEKAVDALGLDPDKIIVYHDASQDAYATALVWQKMFQIIKGVKK
jgi:inhibitor of KinA sporulation pathway (predicted exonuclease)